MFSPLCGTKQQKGFEPPADTPNPRDMSHFQVLQQTVWYGAHMQTRAKYSSFKLAVNYLLAIREAFPTSYSLLPSFTGVYFPKYSTVLLASREITAESLGTGLTGSMVQLGSPASSEMQRKAQTTVPRRHCEYIFG